MNSRANIMYFLEAFCELAGRGGGEGHEAYVEMVRRDMGRIVEGVVGEKDGGGGKGGRSGMGNGANIKVARKVVESLKGKNVLDDSQVREIEDGLRRRERGRADMLLEENGAKDEDAVQQTRHEQIQAQAKDNRRHEHHRDKHGNRQKEGRSNGVNKIDKRAIEQRIEEDRERNKRLRESVWAVGGDDEEELDKLWEEGSDLNEDDYVIAREEAEERAQFARYHRTLLMEAGR